MAISRIQAVSANATSVAITSTTADDLIVVWAYSTSTTIPSLPAGFTNIVGSAGTQQSGRLGYKKSTGGDTTSGTWTNAANVVCMVFRGQHLTAPFGTTPTLGAGNSASLSYSAVTLTVTNGSSVVLGFGGAKGATAGMNGNPGAGAVLTTRTNQTTVNGCDSAARATNMTAQTLAVTTSGRWHTVTIELKALALQQLTMPVDEGFIALTGTAVGLLWGQRAIALPAGSYALTGGGAGLNDGDPVTTWTDGSGTGNNASGVNGPVFKTNILNGRPVVRFNSSLAQQFTLSTPFVVTSGWTIFAVMKGTGATPFMPSLGVAGVGAYPTPEDNNFGPYHYMGSDVYISNGLMTKNGTMDTSVFRVFTGVANANPYVRMEIRVNGTNQSTTNMGSPSTVTSLTVIGRRNADYATGDIAEIIAYNTDLTTTDCANIEKYLGDKYGLTVAGGSAVDPSTVSGLQMWFKADSLAAGGVQFLKGKSMSLVQGSYVYTGQTTGVNWNQRVLALPSGSFALTGFATNLLEAKKIALVQGGYVLAGQVVTLTKTGIAAVLTAVQGAYALTGQALNLKRTRVMSLLQDAYLLTGQVVAMPKGRAMVIVRGQIQALGLDVLFKRTSIMSLAQGAYSLAGQIVLLKRTRIILLVQGAYALTGQLTNLLRKRIAVLVQGAYSLSGVSVSLFKTTIGAFTMPVVQGAYVLAGRAVTLLRPLVFQLIQGGLVLTGRSVLFPRSLRLPIPQGGYLVTGQPLVFLRGRGVLIAPGAYLLTGQIMIPRRTRVMPFAQGSYILTGQITLSKFQPKQMTVLTGTFIVTGRDILFWKAGLGGIYAGQVTGSTTEIGVAGSYVIVSIAGSDVKLTPVTDGQLRIEKTI